MTEGVYMRNKPRKEKQRGNMKISLKIAIIFVILTCIFESVLLVQFYHANYKESHEYAEALSIQTQNIISRNITTLVDNITYYSRLILSSSDMIEALENEDTERMEESLHQFLSLIDFETYINGIYITDMNSHVCSIDRNSVRTFRVENLDEISWFDEVIKLDGTYSLKVNADRVLTQSTIEPMVSLIRAVINPVDFEPVGVLMINIDLDAFAECCEGIASENISTIYVLDDTGKIIVSRSDMKLPEVQEKLKDSNEVNGIRRLSDVDTLFESKNIKGINWKILTGVKIGTVFTGSDEGSKILIVGIEILTLFCFICYFVMDWCVAIPLENVVGFMNRMKKSKFERMEVETVAKNSYLELEVLKETYNQMVDEINLLVERVYEEERFKRKAELNALQEQMKPHFLYNTIDAMSYLALSGKNEELYDALEAFGSYYRILLSKGKEVISVKEEIEMVKDYLELQKLRYGDSLNYVLEVDSQLQKYSVLKMILQPFVENSVNHGIRSKLASGNVWVRGREKNGYLCFEIEDNGIGIERDALKELCSEMLEKNEKSFGVRGTIKRMQIFYEYDIKYEIESEKGKGTTIRLEIPIIDL